VHHYPEPPRPPAGRRRPAPRPHGSRRGGVRGIGRVTAGVFISGFVAALLLAAPLLSGPGGLLTVLTLDTSATGNAPTGADSPVQMGVDGVPDASGRRVEPTSTESAEATGSAAPRSDGSDGTPEPTAASDEPGAGATVAAGEAGDDPEETSSVPSADGADAGTNPADAADPSSAGAALLEAQVLALLNTEREAVGCGSLVADGRLAAVARAHSADMRARGFFDHVDPDGVGPFDRAEAAGLTARAENIARGQQDAAGVVADWMSSPGHRASILNCTLTSVGIGVAEGSGGPWWTQLFA
jgi:uncharacterized protein YkwD